MEASRPAGKAGEEQSAGAASRLQPRRDGPASAGLRGRTLDDTRHRMNLGLGSQTSTRVWHSRSRPGPSHPIQPSTSAASRRTATNLPPIASTISILSLLASFSRNRRVTQADDLVNGGLAGAASSITGGNTYPLCPKIRPSARIPCFPPLNESIKQWVDHRRPDRMMMTAPRRE